MKTTPSNKYIKNKPAMEYNTLNTMWIKEANFSFVSLIVIMIRELSSVILAIAQWPLLFINRKWNADIVYSPILLFQLFTTNHRSFLRRNLSILLTLSLYFCHSFVWFCFRIYDTNIYSIVLLVVVGVVVMMVAVTTKWA